VPKFRKGREVTGETEKMTQAVGKKPLQEGQKRRWELLMFIRDGHVCGRKQVNTGVPRFIM
jgi:hypothetical protein